MVSPLAVMVGGVVKASTTFTVAESWHPKLFVVVNLYVPEVLTVLVVVVSPPGDHK